MSTVNQAAALDEPTRWDGIASIDRRTLDIVNRRRERGSFLRRGWLLRRLLLIADVAGLLLAFIGSSVVTSAGITLVGTGVFLLTLPAWVVLAKLHGLYEGDETRASHSTVDDLVGVFHVATVGVWLAALVVVAAGASTPDLLLFAVFWAAVLLVVPLSQALGVAWVTFAVEGFILIGFLVILRRRGLRPLDADILRRSCRPRARPRARGFRRLSLVALTIVASGSAWAPGACGHPPPSPAPPQASRTKPIPAGGARTRRLP